MGRPKWSTRVMVEDCLPLDISWLRQFGYFKDSNALHFATLQWSGPCEATLGYCVGRSATKGWAVITDPEELVASQPVVLRLRGAYVIPVTVTQPHFSGLRLWFRCPVEHEGRQCGRRVRKLLLPEDQARFGCRYCYNLMYRSSGEHDARVYKLADDDSLTAALKSESWVRRCLAMEAVLLQYCRMHRRSPAPRMSKRVVA